MVDILAMTVMMAVMGLLLLLLAYIVIIVVLFGLVTSFTSIATLQGNLRDGDFELACQGQPGLRGKNPSRKTRSSPTGIELRSFA